MAWRGWLDHNVVNVAVVVVVVVVPLHGRASRHSPRQTRVQGVARVREMTVSARCALQAAGLSFSRTTSRDRHKCILRALRRHPGLGLGGRSPGAPDPPRQSACLQAASRRAARSQPMSLPSTSSSASASLSTAVCLPFIPPCFSAALLWRAGRVSRFLFGARVSAPRARRGAWWSRCTGARQPRQRIAGKFKAASQRLVAAGAHCALPAAPVSAASSCFGALRLPRSRPPPLPAPAARCARGLGGLNARPGGRPRQAGVAWALPPPAMATGSAWQRRADR